MLSTSAFGPPQALQSCPVRNLMAGADAKDGFTTVFLRPARALGVLPLVAETGDGGQHRGLIALGKLMPFPLIVKVILFVHTTALLDLGWFYLDGTAAARAHECEQLLHPGR
jgi:hypothetical protein